MGRRLSAPRIAYRLVFARCAVVRVIIYLEDTYRPESSQARAAVSRPPPARTARPDATPRRTSAGGSGTARGGRARGGARASRSPCGGVRRDRGTRDRPLAL